MKQTKYFLFIVISLTILLQGCQEVIKEVPQENKENLEEPTSHKIQTLNNILELQNFTIVAPKIPKSNNVYRGAANELPNAVLSNLETSELFYVKFQQENQRTILVKDLGHLKNKTGNLFIYSSNSKELHKIIHIKNGIPVWGSTSPSKNSQLSNQRVIVETGCARYEKVYIWNVKIVEWYRENEDGTSTYLWTDEISRTITGSFLVCTEFYNNYSPSSQDSSPRIEEEVVDSRKVMQELKMRRCIESDGNSPLYCNCIINNECEELEDQWEEENIDYNALPDCIAQLVQDMINCDNSDIGNLIKQFDKDGLLGDNFNLIFNTGNLNGDRLAETLPNNEWTDYTITFDINNNKDQTNLSFYATIAHEAVHAILFFRLYTDHPRFAYKYGNDYSSLTFNEVFNLYAEQFPDDLDNPDPSSNHHNYMASKVIDLIAQSVKEMDNGVQSDEFYWNLAWGGLKNTDVWTNFITQTSIDPNWSLPATTSAYRYNINLNRLKNIEQTLLYEELYTHNKSKGKKVLDSNGNCQ